MPLSIIVGATSISLPPDADESLLIGRDVKICRKNAVRRRGCELRIFVFDNFRAVLPQSQDEIVERFVRIGGDFDPRKALIDAILPDFDLVDLEIAAMRQDFVEHLRQDQRIDNMSPQFNGFRNHRPKVARRGRCASRTARRDKPIFGLSFVSTEGRCVVRKLEKPAARGPTPHEKAVRALGQKLNRKFKPPPDPSVLFRKSQSSGERGKS